MQTALRDSNTEGDNSAALWWQREDLGYINSELCFAGHRVQDLAEQFGTPVFVYSLARAKANLGRLHTALQGAGFSDNYRILYAMKANRFAPLLTGLNLCLADSALLIFHLLPVLCPKTIIEY